MKKQNISNNDTNANTEADHINKVERCVFTVTRAFANSPEGGAFVMKYVLLPDTDEHNTAINDLYNEISNHFENQSSLAEGVVLALKYLRSIYLKNDQNAIAYIKQQIENIIAYKTLMDYTNPNYGLREVGRI